MVDGENFKVLPNSRNEYNLILNVTDQVPLLGVLVVPDSSERRRVVGAGLYGGWEDPH